MGNSGTGKLRIGIPVFEISVDRYEIYRYAQPEVVCLWLLVFTYGMLDFAERVGCIIHVPKVPAGGEGSCFDPGGEDGGSLQCRQARLRRALSRLYRCRFLKANTRLQ